jgi:hypothetical protein
LRRVTIRGKTSQRRPWRPAALTSALIAAAVVAPASGRPLLRSCGERLDTDGPGYATIIQNLRVQGVTCAKGLAVARKDLDTSGRSLPVGWRCSTASALVRCRHGNSRVLFVIGGDAG